MAAYFLNLQKLELWIFLLKRDILKLPLLGETLVQTVVEYREALIELFQDISDKKQVRYIVNSSGGYLQLLEKNFFKIL